MQAAAATVEGLAAMAAATDGEVIEIAGVAAMTTTTIGAEGVAPRPHAEASRTLITAVVETQAETVVAGARSVGIAAVAAATGAATGTREVSTARVYKILSDAF